MNKLIEGPLYGDQDIDVLSWEGKGLVRQQVRPSKIILGVSITLKGEQFKHSHLVFPAVLDTGFNKAFEIDGRHLLYWNATPKEFFPLIHRRGRPSFSHTSYDIRDARIWVHVEPYNGPRFTGARYPIPLYVSDEIRVMDPTLGEPQPRFPLLGMDALIQNNWLLCVDGKSSTFEIYG